MDGAAGAGSAVVPGGTDRRLGSVDPAAGGSQQCSGNGLDPADAAASGPPWPAGDARWHTTHNHGPALVGAAATEDGAEPVALGVDRRTDG